MVAFTQICACGTPNWKTKEISVFGVSLEKKSVFVEIPLVSYQVLQGWLGTYCTNSRNDCVHNKKYNNLYLCTYIGISILCYSH